MSYKDPDDEISLPYADDLDDPYEEEFTVTFEDLAAARAGIFTTADAGLPPPWEER